MGLIDRKQIAGMNIHYMMYSLDYFWDCQQRVGIETIGPWAASSHFYLAAMTYQTYYEKPLAVDEQNMKAYEPYIR